MAEHAPPASGLLTLRSPIATPSAPLGVSTLFCERWIFRTDEDLRIAPWQGRGPVSRALFAVALSAPVNDPAKPGEVASVLLALIPSENVLGFVACNTAPPSATRLDLEDSPA